MCLYKNMQAERRRRTDKKFMSCVNFITPYVGLDETEQQTNCSIAVIGVCVFFSQL